MVRKARSVNLQSAIAFVAMMRFVALLVVCVAGSVDVEYELSVAGAAGSDDAISLAFATRLRRFEARMGESNRKIQALSNHLEEVVANTLPPVLASSFLSSRLQPVDADVVHDGLALSEPLRPATQGAVNVIMKEDVSNMQRRAKYQGMRDKIVRLRFDFEHDLATLRGD